MNKRFLIKISIILACFFIAGCSVKKQKVLDSGQTVQVITPEEVIEKIQPPLGKLMPGERLYYKVSWLGLHVGQAFLEIKEAEPIDNQPVLLVELTAQTTGFFRFIYKVDGLIQSYVNSEGLRPVKYYSETKINKKFILKKMRYDFKSRKVYAEDRKGKYELEITDDILDPLGVFYYFRKNEVCIDTPIDILVNAGKKNFPVRVYAKRQHAISVPAGRFWAFQIEPTKESERQFDDALNAEGSMRIWFSADPRRLPLYIALKVPVGSAVATLMSIEQVQPN